MKSGLQTTDMRFSPKEHVPSKYFQQISQKEPMSTSSAMLWRQNHLYNKRPHISIAFVETTFEWLFVWIGLASSELFLWLCVICSFLNAMGLLWLPIISAGMITRIFISFFHGRPESSLTNIKRRYYLAGICHGRNRGGISDIILL